MYDFSKNEKDTDLGYNGSGTLDVGVYFYDTKSRHNFIFKVYCILNTQLLFTCFTAMAFYTVPELKEFALNSMPGQIIFWIAVVLGIVLSIALTCFVQLQRTYPWNLLLLALFTLCESYMIAWVCLHYQIFTIITAFGVTVLIVFLLTIFACQTKYDFTSNRWSIGLFIACIAVMCISLLNTFVFHLGWLQTVVSCVLLVIFCFYLIYDTQKIIGGDHRNQYSEKDYVFAALSLYIDIIGIFLELLSLFGGNGGNSDCC